MMLDGLIVMLLNCLIIIKCLFLRGFWWSVEVMVEAVFEIVYEFGTIREVKFLAYCVCGTDTPGL